MRMDKQAAKIVHQEKAQLDLVKHPLQIVRIVQPLTPAQLHNLPPHINPNLVVLPVAENHGQLIDYQVPVISMEPIVELQNIRVIVNIVEAVVGGNVSLTVMGTHAVVIHGIPIRIIMVVLVLNVYIHVVGKANIILVDGEFNNTNTCKILYNYYNEKLFIHTILLLLLG